MSVLCSSLYFLSVFWDGIFVDLTMLKNANKIEVAIWDLPPYNHLSTVEIGN